MSRATVTTAVVAWLAPNTVPFLTAVNGHPAKITPEGEFDLGANAGTGGIIHVWIQRQAEHRIALGGAAVNPASGGVLGRKRRDYEVVLLSHLRSMKPRAEDVGADHDAFIDGIVARIEADRTLGTAGAVNPIFIAGEGTHPGAEDITVEAALPVLLAASLTQVFATVRFNAAEVIQS